MEVAQQCKIQTNESRENREPHGRKAVQLFSFPCCHFRLVNMPVDIVSRCNCIQAVSITTTVPVCGSCRRNLAIERRAYGTAAAAAAAQCKCASSGWPTASNGGNSTCNVIVFVGEYSGDNRQRRRLADKRRLIRRRARRVGTRRSDRVIDRWTDGRTASLNWPQPEWVSCRHRSVAVISQTVEWWAAEDQELANMASYTWSLSLASSLIRPSVYRPAEHRLTGVCSN